MDFNKVKVVATLGPASDSEDSIKKLIKAGVNVFRLNMSHGDHDYFRRVISCIKRINKQLKVYTPIFLDLPGQKLRTGKLGGDKLEIKEGQEYTLGEKGQIPVTNSILKRIKLKGKILLSDGKIELKPVKRDGDIIITRALNNGTLLNEQSINADGLSYSDKYPTKKDIDGIKFGLSQGIRIFALSFVSSAKDVAAARRIAGGDSTLIAKIERRDAVKNFKEIVEVADVIMIARGDLGLNMDIAEVPKLQKELIDVSNKCNKPVITATQMLESMTKNVLPTRAEADDVFTAISEGTDAVMLSEETAIGDYPIKAVKMLRHIISKYGYKDVPEKMYEIRNEHDAIISAAVNIMSSTNIRDAVVITPFGRSAFRLSRYHMRVRIFALTDSNTAIDRLNFSRDVISIKIKSMKNFKAAIKAVAKKYGLKKAILVSGLYSDKALTEDIRILKLD